MAPLAKDRRAAVRRIEEAGIDHLMGGDHVSFFGGFGFDGLVQAASMLTASDRLSVHLGVYLLPLRHPVLVARQLSDLAQLAPGRLVLGVGVGGEDRHEYEVCNVDPSTRGRRCNESLTVLRALLDGQAVSSSGEFFPLDEALVLPAPAEPVPILVGGRSDAAVRRAARLGDGWLAIWVSPRRWAQVLELVDEQAIAAERGQIEWRHELQAWVGFGSSREQARERLAKEMQAFYGIGFESFERYSPYGRPEDVAQALASYVEVGCRSFNLIPGGVPDDEAAEAVAEVRRLLR
jgi:alkanesulfonate monooxygenase SsuD/methylene tetrahydromethanopterin reductase-like flavin-dependent oxidoreductase (luciferase family)